MYFCIYKSRKPRVSACRHRGVDGAGIASPFTIHIRSTMENKTKVIKIHVTPTAYNEIKRRSKPFGTVTNFINQAIKEFSDKTVRDRQETARLLAERYTEIDAKLAHAGANLNQVVRRINELAQAGLPYEQILLDNAMPRIEEVYDIVNQFRNEIRESTMLALRGKKR